MASNNYGTELSTFNVDALWLQTITALSTCNVVALWLQTITALSTCNVDALWLQTILIPSPLSFDETYDFKQCMMLQPYCLKP